MSKQPRVQAGPGTAAARHDAMVAAYDAQRARYASPNRRDAWGTLAQRFQADPRRPLDSFLTKIAAYIEPADVLIDVGGGAGRLSLPLALRCKEVVVIDPSPGMGEAFEKVLQDSEISNARFVQADWNDAKHVEGDVALVAHVTYFVREIVQFIEQLQSAAQRRVLVGMRSVPPPNQVAGFFRLAHNEELAPVPGHEELLSVLEELGIAAEVIDAGPATAMATSATGTTRQQAVRAEVEAATNQDWIGSVTPERLAQLFEEHFDELLVETEQGFVRRSFLGGRDLLITWETR
jgi:hypothetical protein